MNAIERAIAYLEMEGRIRNCEHSEADKIAAELRALQSPISDAELDKISEELTVLTDGSYSIRRSTIYPALKYLRDRLSAQPQLGSDDYTGWLCFKYRGDNNQPWLSVCDSDTPGAFKVYRHPAQPQALREAEQRVVEQNVNCYGCWECSKDGDNKPHDGDCAIGQLAAALEAKS